MTVLIIGGSSGMGLALAELLLADGTEVTIAGRSADRLARAAARLDGHGRLRTEPVDIRDEDQVRRLVTGTAPLHHVAVSAVDATRAIGPLADFALADARAVLDTKLLGPWLVAKHAAAHLAPGASITYTAGFFAHRPAPGSSMATAANAALEALVGALAVELAPIRVNAVSPGWTDTPLWDTIAGDDRAERFAAMAARLPAGRVGRPEDIAQAVQALMRNGFVTGTVMHVDGGQRLI